MKHQYDMCAGSDLMERLAEIVDDRLHIGVTDIACGCTCLAWQDGFNLPVAFSLVEQNAFPGAVEASKVSEELLVVAEVRFLALTLSATEGSTRVGAEAASHLWRQVAG